MEISSELLTALVSAAVCVVGALAAAASSALNYSAKKKDLQRRNVELEAANAELQAAMLNNSYVICPKCGAKIYLKEVRINYEKKDEPKG